MWALRCAGVIAIYNLTLYGTRVYFSECVCVQDISRSLSQDMCVRIKASDGELGIILATNGLAMADSELTVLSYHKVVEIFQYRGGEQPLY